MLEANVRIVLPGPSLYVWTRRADVTGTDLAHDLLQRACGRLRSQHGLAAVPVGNGTAALLVGARDPIKPVHLAGDDWELDVRDAGLPARRLCLSDQDGPTVLPRLIERALEVTLSRSTELWTLDGRRIWHEATPFVERDGIAAYRRYQISAVAIDGEGIGIAVDIGTAFFTVQNLAYFFDPTADAVERDRRAKHFEDLTGRPARQKGTLDYDMGGSHMKCYFDSAPGKTCAMTGPIRAKGRSYESLLAYYQEVNPRLPVAAETPAVRVSFPNRGRPVYVAADRLRARVMNDDLPDALASVDKIAPARGARWSRSSGGGWGHGRWATSRRG